MFRYLTTAGAATLMMASAASAQQTQAPAEAPATQTAPAQTAPAQKAPAQATPADTQAQVQQLVKAELPKYDADKSGDLSETEFTAWVMELRSKAEAGDPNAPKADAAAKAEWAKAAFAKADANQDKKADAGEVAAFFAAAN